MNTIHLCRCIAAVTVVLVSVASSAGLAGDPLEIINIRPDLGAGNRLSRAYPGLEYNIRAAVIGGEYPYSFALSDAPAGMTVDARTGEVRWPSPSTDARPTLTVSDASGVRVSAAWPIKVTADGFRFVDAVNGRPSAGSGCGTGCGTGSRDNPWRTLLDVHAAGAPGEFVYFLNGTYTPAGIPRASAGSPWERVVFTENARPVVWMAAPGHAPVLDFAANRGASSVPLIRFRGNDVYVDGLETVNSYLIAFQFESGAGAGPTFRRLRMHGHGPGIDGSNAAFIMTTTSPTPSDFMVIQDSEFRDVTGESVTIKIYAQRKLLIEDTSHRATPVAIELKDDVRQFTVRGNRFQDVTRTAIGGNMHEATTHGTISFNNVRAAVALDLNQDGMAGRIDVLRNTFVGRVQVRNTDAADGPFIIAGNVIVSTDRGVRGSRVSFESVSAPDRVHIGDNLTGSPGDRMVDDAGNLASRWAAHVGAYGHLLRSSH